MFILRSFVNQAADCGSNC